MNEQTESVATAFMWARDAAALWFEFAHGCGDDWCVDELVAYVRDKLMPTDLARPLAWCAIAAVLVAWRDTNHPARGALDGVAAMRRRARRTEVADEWCQRDVFGEHCDCVDCRWRADRAELRRDTRLHGALSHALKLLREWRDSEPVLLDFEAFARERIVPALMQRAACDAWTAWALAALALALALRESDALLECGTVVGFVGL